MIVGDAAGPPRATGIPVGPASRKACASETCVPALETLLQQIGLGDVAAFGQLYEQTARRVYALARAVVWDGGLAEDITQEVCSRSGATPIISTASEVQRSPGSWSSPHSRAVDLIRRIQTRQRHDCLFASHSYYPATDSAVEHTIRTDNDRRIQAALTQLTPLQRQAIHLTYFLGHSNAEASQLLDIPIPTFKDRFRTALAALRRLRPGN